MIEELVVKNYQTSEGLDPGKEPEQDIRKMSKKKKQSLFNKLFGVK
jgi:hypothetical protein